MTCKSLDDSIRGISGTNIGWNKLKRDTSLEEVILEDITSFIIHNLDIEIVSRSCECVLDFFTPLLIHVPDLYGRDSVKISLL